MRPALEKGRAWGKGKKAASEESQPVYVGDRDGLVVCTIAVGSCIEQVPAPRERGEAPSLVDITALKSRAGHLGTLQWTSDTLVTNHLEPRDSHYKFPYQVDQASKDFATWAIVQNGSVGDIAALVIRVLCVEERFVEATSEPYLQVAGLDMDGVPTDPLRFWRYESGDIIEGSTCIVRGLKVVVQQQWNYELQRYAPNANGSKTVEVTSRTAVEDVSDIAVITAFFA